MNRKIIIIAGYLAAGKSTLAIRLSKELGVPYFVKDTFKTALCAGVTLTGREESSRFSAVTFNAMMYAAERLMEIGHPLIIEGNFSPRGVNNQAGVIRALLEKHGYRPLTFRLTGETRVLHKRFTGRDGLPERGANALFTPPSFEEFDAICRSLGGFDAGGEIVDVDTTDFGKTDFQSHIETARKFIEEAKQGGKLHF